MENHGQVFDPILLPDPLANKLHCIAIVDLDDWEAASVTSTSPVTQAMRFPSQFLSESPSARLISYSLPGPLKIVGAWECWRDLKESFIRRLATHEGLDVRGLAFFDILLGSSETFVGHV